MTDVFETVAVKASGTKSDSPLSPALAARADILAMTQQAHDVSLAPKDPGGLSHAIRAALACRMARLNQEERLAAHFAELMDASSPAPAVSEVANPKFVGGEDARLNAILRHTDLVTTNPKAVVASDIQALTDAGVSEDDIVRLSELVAFVSYQVRLTIGLRLMGDRS